MPSMAGSPREGERAIAPDSSLPAACSSVPPVAPTSRLQERNAAVRQSPLLDGPEEAADMLELAVSVAEVPADDDAALATADNAARVELELEDAGGRIRVCRPSRSRRTCLGCLLLRASLSALRNATRGPSRRCARSNTGSVGGGCRRGVLGDCELRRVGSDGGNERDGRRMLDLDLVVVGVMMMGVRRRRRRHRRERRRRRRLSRRRDGRWRCRARRSRGGRRRGMLL